MQVLHDDYRKPLIHWIQNPASVETKWHNSTVRSILTNLPLSSYRNFFIDLECAKCFKKGLKRRSTETNNQLQMNIPPILEEETKI